MPLNRTTLFIFAVHMPLLIGVFLIEVYTNVLETVAYIPVFLVILWLSRNDRRAGVWAGALATLLLISGYVISEEIFLSPSSLTNRIMAIVVIWLAIVFTNKYRRSNGAELRHRNLLHAIFNNATEAIFILTGKGQFVMANPWAEKMSGYSSAELVGKNVEMLVPKHLKKLHIVQRMKLLDGSEKISVGSENGFYAEKKDGTVIPVDLSIGHFNIGADPFLIVFALDITEHKRSMEEIKQLNENLEIRVIQRTHDLTKALDMVERANIALRKEIEERRKTEQKLTAAQALYLAVMHNFPDGLIGVIDEELKYIIADGDALSELGWKNGKIIGKHVTDVISSMKTENITQLVGQAVHGHKVSFSIKNQDKTFDVRAVPVPNEDGKPKEGLVVIRDVSERTKYEEGLLKSLEKQRELSELKSRFVTLASHEFRTPLTNILSSAFLLESYSGEKFETEKPKHIGRIKRSARILTEILNDFLSLGKLEEGKVQPNCVTIELNEFIRDLMAELDLLKRPGQRITFHHTGDPFVWSDRLLLRNIINNLVSNAIKYTGDDDEIFLDTVVTAADFVLSVTDHGIGIPEEDRKNIFSRFFRAHNSSNIQGTGLGLNIVKKYAVLLGGNVEFESKLNEGTKFIVTLPQREYESIKPNTYELHDLDH